MRGIVERVEKNTLIIPSSITKREGLFFPRRGQIGIRPGTSVNILHPSFKVKGFFTKNDIEYIKVAKRLNMHKYMLSYVECTNDVTLMFKHDPLAEVVLKIESERGLEFVVNEYPKLKRRYGNQLNLMAARGDLYMEINMPDQIIDASMKILEVEPNAIMASRLMGSLKYFPKKDVECADVTDLYANMMFGYKQFMVGDELTTKEDRLIQSILLFDVMSDKYETFQRAKKRSICRPAGYSNGGGVIAKPEFSPPGAPQPLAYEEDVEDPSPGYTPPQTFNAEDCVELEDSLDQKPKVVDSESDANGFSGSPPYFPSQRSSVTSRTVHGVGPHRRQSKLNLEED